MNCSQCGAPLEKGQRFCVKCGAPVLAAAALVEEKPKMDLSAYFDEPAPPRPAPQPEARQTRPPVREPARPARQAKAAPSRTDRGLNIALMICGVLAVAVITFLLILLFWPSGNQTPAPAPTNEPVVVTAQPEPDPQPTQGGAGDAPVLIITPSPAPIPTPAPTSAPTPTPAPTAAPDSASGYLLPDSDTRYLTEDDLKGLTHEQLCFARNEIFARHGRIFQTPQIAAYFGAKTWYHGTVSAADFDNSVFNKYERANISFISDYEKKNFGGSYY